MSTATELFLRSYPSEKPRVVLAGDLIQALSDGGHPLSARRVGTDLVSLWMSDGFGKQRGGMLDLMDPRHYIEAYERYFDGDAEGRIPFMINAFGEVFGCRRLLGREVEISVLHPYGPKVDILAYDFGDFVDRVLCTDDGLQEALNVPLYGRVSTKLPRLKPGEVYGFDPAVLEGKPEGTRVDETYFVVVDCLTHLGLLERRRGFSLKL